MKRSTLQTRRELNVFYESKKVGTLVVDEENVFSFRYSAYWLGSADRFPLSLAMPLSSKVYGNAASFSFFENLLPEGEIRENLQRKYRIKGPFEFLKKYGMDCAGAVIVTTENRSPFRKSNAVLEPIEPEYVFQAIEEQRSIIEVLGDKDRGYLSIAGAQDKFAAIFKEGRFWLPTQGQATSHIVKLPITRSKIRESVFNEYFCMELARAVGLKVPRCFVHPMGKYFLYVIERYDRKPGQKVSIRRLHQQDFCQAQGIHSDMKYEVRGGPSLKDNYELVAQNVHGTKKSKNLSSLLDWVCFNLILGNNDTHSKNLSFLLKGKQVELAPFYDLLCTAAYPSLSKYFSFLIGGREDFSRIGKKQFHQLEDELGLKRNAFLSKVKGMEGKLMASMGPVAERVLKEFPHVKIIKKISEVVEKRVRNLKRQG